MKRFFVILILLSCFFYAKAEDFYFQHYGINEGLSSSVVFGIAEDKSGLLWIATTEGVDKFDGLNFKHYSLPQLSANGVLDYMEYFIKSDSNGQIWLATRTGLIYKYDVLTDAFRLIHQFKQEANISSIIRLRNIFIDHNDDILISISGGVWKLNSKSFELNQLSENGSTLYITQDERNLYFVSNNEGIQVLDPSFQPLYMLYPCGDNNSSNIAISRLFIDNNTQTLWGVSEKEGVFFINLKNSKCVFPNQLEHYKNLAIRSITRFSADKIIIGVDGVGLVIWDTTSQTVSHEIVFQDGYPGTLSSNAIYDIYRNKDGIFFISTHRGGVNVYNPNKLNFGIINSIPNNKNSLSSNYILSLIEIAPEIIAFGTYEGISIWNKRTNQWQQLTDEDKNISEVILSLSLDNNQNLWASSFTHSLMYFKNNAGIYDNSRSTQKRTKLVSKKILTDGQNNIWVSNYDGLYMYSGNQIQKEYFPLFGLLTFTNLNDSLLVLGTENGLSFFDTKIYKLLNFGFIDRANINMRLIKCMKTDNRNRLWVGTKLDGLFVVDFKNKSIKNISVENGLPTNHIFGIANEGDNIWVSTLKGVSTIDSNYNVVNYTHSDGIASIDFNYDAALCDSGGMLYFGTNDGVVTLMPREMENDKPQKNIVFSEFRLNHKRIIPGKDSPLKNESNITRHIILRHNQNSFSFGFECVDFIQPERGRYHWKLEGFNDKWLTADEMPDINYTNLSPGNYSFTIKVLDEKEVLISNEKTIKITILNPWWLRGWAYLLYTLIFVILFGAIYYFYQLRSNSKNSAERLGFLINLAHDIKTPLLLIKAPLNDLMSNENITGAARKNVNIALSSAERLHRQMIQFLDMGNLSKFEKSLSLEHTNLKQFIKEKTTVFKVFAEKKDIALSFQSNRADLYIKTDKEILDKILSNLLSNAIKYTNSGGEVKVKLKCEKNWCSILVCDTGIGILKSEQKNIFKPFYRTERGKESGSTGNGMGLALASNLAKMLRGKLTLVESSENGTSFGFSFPFELSEEEQQSVAEGKEQTAIEKNRIKLLLVEDDEDLLSYSVGKLEEFYQVETAKNGLEAIEKCVRILPNIIISDVKMPHMNGLQFCRKLKSDIKTSHIPVILFTGLDSKEEIMEGLEAGADDYIVKPFEFDILIKKIDALLNNRKLLQKKFLLQTGENLDVGFSSKLDDEWIGEVNRFVEEHIEDPELNPNILYKQFGMSRSAFYHKTKSLVDLSPSELIRTIRLKKAKILLGTPGNDISEVAYKLGFKDPKYFSTLFKRYLGQTPSSFIEEKKNLQDN